MVFDYTQTKDPIRYHYLREEEAIFMKGRVQNNVEALLEVEYKNNHDEQPIFSLKILNYKQSNAKGFYRWAGELHSLRNRIDFKLDENNRLGEIMNINTVRNRFTEIKPRLLVNNASQKEAAGMISGVEQLLRKPARFAHSLRFAHPYLSLFSGIYGKEITDDGAEQGYRELPNFIHLDKVPILTDEKLGKSGGKFQEVEVLGKLDKENFDQEKLTSFIRLLRNRPRVPSLLELNYTERYRIDLENHWPEQTLCTSLAMVPGTLYQNERTILKRIAV